MNETKRFGWMREYDAANSFYNLKSDFYDR